MKEIIEFTNENVGFVTAVYTFLTLGLMVIAYFTLKSSKDAIQIAKKGNENATRPILIGRAEEIDHLNPHRINLFLKNAGNSPCQIEKIKIHGKIYSFETKIEQNIPNYATNAKDDFIEFENNQMIDVGEEIKIEINEELNRKRVLFLGKNEKTKIEVKYSSIIHSSNYLHTCEGNVGNWKRKDKEI